MRKNSFRAIDYIKVFNSLKFRLSLFTREELRENLRVIGIPCSLLFFSELVRMGIIIRVGINTYSFTNPKKPIYYIALQNVYHAYQVKNNNYSKIHRDKKIKELENKKRIQKSIEFLESKGYKILFPK